MKRLNLLVLIVIIATLFPLVISAQTVEFGYDDAGNRTSRDVIYLQPQTVADSTNTKQSEVFEDNLGEIKLTISPNPNGGRFTVKIEGYDLESPPQLFLHSMNGTMVYENQNMKMLNEIDISSRDNGTYILSLIIGDTRKTWKIIKQ